MTTHLEQFEAQRPGLEGLAYRMLADATEAQDVVQDAWLRWDSTCRDDVERPAAFLHRTVTRLCLDRLKSARARREQYVGPWLPEPVATDRASGPDADPEAHATLADDLSFALLLALERLTPTERAAFLLHDVFDHDYGEIAATLERSEDACRQLVSRARRHVRGTRARGPSTTDPDLRRDRHRDLLERFVAACATGDTASLAALLRDDAVLVSDGGGVVAAARKPVHGVRAITRFQLGLRDLHERNGWRVETDFVELNGEPAVLVWVDGALSQAVLIETSGGRIARIFGVRHPDKLARLAARYAGARRRSGEPQSGGTASTGTGSAGRASARAESAGPEPGDPDQAQ